MKLKRIISALIVFTLVMASAVCSVNAAGTYQTTTSYDIVTGDITVNVDITGAAKGSMVSYMIVAPVTNGEGEDATTSYDVQADGSNILHIDQATVGEDGKAKMDQVIAPFNGDDGFKGAKVKFVSTVENDLTAYTVGKIQSMSDGGHTYAKSVEEFDDYVTDVTIYSDGATNAANIYVTYVRGAEVIRQNVSGNMNTVSRWNTGGDDGEKTLINDRPTTTGTHSSIHVPSDADAIIIDAAGKPDRDMSKAYNITMKGVAASFTGKQNTASATETLYEKGAEGNLMINGRYKDSVKDQKLGANVNYTPGSMIVLGGTSGKLDKANALYMSVDATPLISKYKDVDGNEYNSITFLATASGVDASNAGLRIFAYPKGTFTSDTNIAKGTVDDPTTSETEESAYIEVGTFRNVSIDDNYSKTFGIELVDTKGVWNNFADYDFEAVPVYYEAGSDEAIQLSVLGDSEESLSKYYTVNRTTGAKIGE